MGNFSSNIILKTTLKNLISNIYVLICFVLILELFPIYFQKISSKGRIVGGVTVEDGKFPFMASLRKPNLCQLSKFEAFIFFHLKKMSSDSRNGNKKIIPNDNVTLKRSILRLVGSYIKSYC